MKQIKDVKDLQKGGPYSHSVIFNDLIFVSGQTGQVTGKKNIFREQFENAINNISLILKENGTTLDNVLKVTVYLSDASFFKEMNDLFSKHFPKNPPARTTVVTKFVVPDVLVEIDVIASK